MKKLNLFFLIVLSSLCFWGCKSTPPETNINPLELLDNKSQYYFRIPVSVDPVLVDRVLKANVSSLSDSDSKLIVSRINTIYAGYTRRRNYVEFQISSDCSFPKSITSKVFTKKNGFEARKLNLNNAEPGTTPYDVYSTQGVDISLPEERIALLGRDVDGMLGEYHRLFQKIEGQSYNNLSSELFEYLNYDSLLDENEIRFWATNPSSFLTLLTGARLNLALQYVRGTIKPDPKLSKQYIMQFEFEFKDERIVRAARGALSLAFGLADSNVYMLSPTTLVISDIKISKEQVYRIFTL